MHKNRLWEFFVKDLSLKKERIKMQNKKGRPPVIPQEFYAYDYVSAAKKENIARYRIKLLAMEQIKKGKGYREVSKIFNVHETTIKIWVKLVVKEGLNGLKLKKGRGRKPKLKKNCLADFKSAIAELQNTRSGGRINVADITKMANERFNTTYKVKGMYGFLHKIGMVWVSARSKHPSHNSEAQQAFKKTLSTK
jgi:transposase